MTQFERFHGHYSKTSQGREDPRKVSAGAGQQRTEAQVLHAQAQPLQAVRTAARLFAQIRHLRSVFPRVGAARSDPWSFKAVLVTGCKTAARALAPAAK